MNSDYSNHFIALTIHIKGLVQGVGFRPFVYRLAREHHLNGWVVNGTDGVTIKVEGAAGNMAPFVENLRNKAPVVSEIDEILVDQDLPEGVNGFYILASQDMTDETSEISPDIAVCNECLADMKTQPHRVSYAFINCTNCGPRFSIIKDFPYDRAKTTMAPFVLCEKCNNEYTEITDRRFHAQPVACNDCGPQYILYTAGKSHQDIHTIISATAQCLANNGIVAIKGTGGFHLMCDALNEKAVDALRALKKREGKPFAVMFRDLQTLKDYAHVSDEEAATLESWRRPIVILHIKKEMCHGIGKGLDTLGAFLPYMPFHYLLFEKLTTPAIVLTSGNLADEPIIIDNEKAIKEFSALTDALVTYNRDIYNRTDDSVVRLISGKERVLRRSRGYAPSPVRLGFSVDGIMGTGAELSNCFCIGKSNRAYLSQHIGDLKNHETLEFYEESVKRFSQLFRVRPHLMASDLHPDYLSTRFADKSRLDVIRVQHHHAHIASCMAENGLDDQVIGVALDGTGYGTDGKIWGSEFMVCDFEQFERKAHFRYMPMPGGDRAAEQPWRMGLSLLWQAFGEEMVTLDLPLFRVPDEKTCRNVIESIRKNINCPLTSGAGRLFDGIAAITGICMKSMFHAEAPMRLESAIKRGTESYYDFETGDSISFIPAIKQIVNDVVHHVDPCVISARFHNTIVDASMKTVLKIASETGIEKVALSGGTFQNKYLHERLESRLVENGLTVYTHSRVPCNDGGVALGQVVVAGRMKE
ncbi:MAG TPA: carbamoyltransferase HypF [Bacteroidales bacterium]|nr:carbamoyltransferase HypF [Bacteroidales bacterium]